MPAPDAMHEVLERLRVPAGVHELAEVIREAFRQGHDLKAPDEGPADCWICWRCNAWADWAADSGTVRRSPRLRLSCVAATREAVVMGQASRLARAWLAEHDREASR